MSFSKTNLLLMLGVVTCTRLTASVNVAAEDPGYLKYVGMRQYINCPQGYSSSSSCDHFLNPGEVLSFSDGPASGCDIVYIAENVTLIPRPGFQQYQVWISDWSWKELVANPDGTNPRWEDRTTPGHWITASLPTARSAAPGAWSLENIASNPRAYYDADPVMFTSMLPDWRFNLLISGGTWGDWALPNPDEFRNARWGHMSNTTTTWPVEIPKMGGAAITAIVAIFLEITKHLDFSYITYEKQYIWNPTLFYYGQSAGRGIPEAVLMNRQRYHERNHDHWDARMRSYVYTRGMSDYGDFAMHGREQQLVDLAGGLVSAGGRATNDIRPVARYNLKGYPYWLTANHAFGFMAEYSGYWWNKIVMMPPEDTAFSVVLFKEAIP